MTDRINYVGSALAALDQALNADGSMLNRADGIARAQTFALLAIADELRQAREAQDVPAAHLIDEDEDDGFDRRRVLVDVTRAQLDIGDRIASKHLNEAGDDYVFSVFRAVWAAERAGIAFDREDILDD